MLHRKSEKQSHLDRYVSVDLIHVYLLPSKKKDDALPPHSQSDRNSTDECYELSTACHTHTDVPSRDVTWWLKCPGEERSRVVEPHGRVEVLDIVVSKKVIDFFELQAVKER